MIVQLEDLSTEELRKLKKDITKELSKRHKEKTSEVFCWTCNHCYYDENVHPYKLRNRGGYKCMKCGTEGRLITTKYKAPTWCPTGGVKNG